MIATTMSNNRLAIRCKGSTAVRSRLQFAESTPVWICHWFRIDDFPRWSCVWPFARRRPD